jgi:S-(hydroxymethyl)glutathione dehydrogenase / alcohol dehydrogenase
MKAAVCYEFSKPLVVEDVEVVPPGNGEVKVKTVATAVCHSDIHLVKGQTPFSPPIVPGHETAGYVDEIGAGVTDLERGQPVLVSALISCGQCLMCTTGKPHLCEATWERDSVWPFRNHDGRPLAHFSRVGGFAEYVVVHRSQVVKLPSDMPLDSACLLACGVATGFGAVAWRAKVEAGKSCAIVGVGGVGINSVQAAFLAGAYPIIAVDVNPGKLEAAKAFGASHTANSKESDAVEAVRQLTKGRGADYVFVTVGSSAAMSQSIMMSAARGTIVWVGIPDVSETVKILPFMMLKEERTLAGCWMGSTSLQTDIPKLVELYQAGKLKLDELITERYPLERVDEAMAAVERGEALRNVVMFQI